MSKFFCVFMILGALFVGCTGEPVVEEGPLVTGVHHAMCGCSIEGIDACGNYVQMDGEFVKLIHPDLGSMEFCDKKKDGQDIEVVGRMRAGEFVADSWELAK